MMKKTLPFIKKYGLDMLSVTVILVSLIYVLFFGTINTNGSSMEPTYQSGDVSIIRKDNTHLKAGDIVIVNGTKLGQRNGMPYNDMIKRVIALPGDTLTILDDVLYINDVAQEEAYIREPMQGNIDFTITLPADEYFVMGDNRNFSSDSRVYGTVTKDMIVGYTVATVFHAKN